VGLISAFQVAWITGMTHQHQVCGDLKLGNVNNKFGFHFDIVS
jgi:hypothetical protein